MLRYRSGVLRALEAVALAGLFLAGAAEQKQTLEVELSPAYREDPVRGRGLAQRGRGSFA